MSLYVHSGPNRENGTYDDLSFDSENRGEEIDILPLALPPSMASATPHRLVIRHVTRSAASVSTPLMMPTPAPSVSMQMSPTKGKKCKLDDNNKVYQDHHDLTAYPLVQ